MHSHLCLVYHHFSRWCTLHHLASSQSKFIPLVWIPKLREKNSKNVSSVGYHSFHLLFRITSWIVRKRACICFLDCCLFISFSCKRKKIPKYTFDCKCRKCSRSFARGRYWLDLLTGKYAWSCLNKWKLCVLSKMHWPETQPMWNAIKKHCFLRKD